MTSRETMTMTDRVQVDVAPRQDDDVRWLALTIRQGLKLIVRMIEKRYGLDETPASGRRN